MHPNPKLLLAPIALATILALPAASAPTRGYSSAPFRAGEKLRYKIKLGFIRLGTMEVTQARAEGGQSSRYVVSITAKRARGVPFITMNWANRAWLDSADPSNRIFIHEEAGDPPGRLVYRSDSSATRLSIEDRDARGYRRAHLDHPSPLFDSVGMFMLIRGLCESDSELDVPTIVAQQARNTHFRFTSETREMDVDGFPAPVRVRRFTARSDYDCQSCGGLNGDFQGWVTDDDAAIPVRIAMKIAVGSIKILLESVERPGAADTLQTNRASAAQGVGR